MNNNNNNNNNNKNNNSNKIIPIVTYTDASRDKSLIISENKRKPGIYKWTPKKSGKNYVGSSVDLADRLRAYYSKVNKRVLYIKQYLNTVILILVLV